MLILFVGATTHCILIIINLNIFRLDRITCALAKAAALCTTTAAAAEAADRSSWGILLHALHLLLLALFVPITTLHFYASPHIVSCALHIVCRHIAATCWLSCNSHAPKFTSSTTEKLH